MVARKSLLLVAAAVAGALFTATEVRTHSEGGPTIPPGAVPVPEPGPLSCTTTSGNFRFTAVLGPKGEFPKPVSCINNVDDCAEYKYTLTKLGSKNADHVIFAVSADLAIDSASPSATITPPGLGDSVTDFLENAYHEYPVRMNPTPQLPAKIVTKGASSPRISTILVKSGYKNEICLIAGPGVPVSQFTALALTQDQLVAGGKCLAHLVYDAAGNIIDVQTEPPCTVTTGDVFINGQKLQDNRSPNGITHGTNTCTTYGPPIPSPARTVCR
jgi:hypothetical protein